MYIERDILREYPFDGVFYEEIDEVPDDGDLLADDFPEDGDLFGEAGEYSDTGSTEENPIQSKENIILRTKCDIQETNKMFNSGAITANFNVYFPFDKQSGIELRRGMLFRSEVYGMPIGGTVIGVFPSQMGGCVAYIKDVDV